MTDRYPDTRHEFNRKHAKFVAAYEAHPPTADWTVLLWAVVMVVVIGVVTTAVVVLR
ncbi:hypothetical protein [Rhodococcus sp. B10]|uniref:hypothetical protein n=1 Tax=Rhodococcus sp. B10 TaxID=2695876 RepID=UPI00142FAE48|nr:hypothetical protein [Rhodococcus sp. B10]NIL77673.1 hypothetical protein [Rhodococcus sp. B10]